MTTIQESLYIACVQCKHHVFAERGGAMHTSGICRVCREFGGRKPPVSRVRAPRAEVVDLAPEPVDPNPYGVRPGQAWVSVDPRDQGREIEVLEVFLDQGYAEVLSHGKGGSKRRRIKLTGFTRTKGRGYVPKAREVLAS